MFGYTVPLYSRLSPSGLTSYRRYYCETCHQLRHGFGLISTLAVNYDMTFNTIIMNSVTGGPCDIPQTDPLFCVLRKTGTDSEIFGKMAAYTVLLTKWELVDDDMDKPSVKSSIASVALGRAIAKAERMYPEYDEAVGRGFEELRRMEERKCDDPVLMGNRFGKALVYALKDISGSDDGSLEGLFVNLTTMVYLMDAVDDLEADYMDGTYNPLLTGYGRFVNKESFINDNLYELTDMMNQVLGNLQMDYSMVRKTMTIDTDLTDNIIYYGIPQSAKSVMSCNCSAKPSLKNACDARLKRNATY